MLIRVDPASHRPIYQQIVAQITFGVAAGTLPAGKPVLSVRQLASDLLVNPNTVARAYRELQSRGILQQRRGLGLFVTRQAPSACRKTRTEQVRGRVREVLVEAAASQLPLCDIEAMVQEELERLGSHAST